MPRHASSRRATPRHAVVTPSSRRHAVTTLSRRHAVTTPPPSFANLTGPTSGAADRCAPFIMGRRTVMGVEPCNKMLWGSTCYFLARLCVGNNCTNSCISCELLVMRARTGVRATPQPPHSPHTRRVRRPRAAPPRPADSGTQI